MFYLPLLQSNIEECANVSLHDLVDEHQDVDYVLPLKITVKQILLEVSTKLYVISKFGCSWFYLFIYFLIFN